MHLQRLCVLERLRALGAVVRLGGVVALGVAPQLGAGCKALEALGALEGFLARVDPHVFLHVAFLSKVLETKGKYCF